MFIYVFVCARTHTHTHTHIHILMICTTYVHRYSYKWSKVSPVLREDGDDPFELEGVEIGLVLLVTFSDWTRLHSFESISPGMSFAFNHSKSDLMTGSSGIKAVCLCLGILTEVFGSSHLSSCNLLGAKKAAPAFPFLSPPSMVDALLDTVFQWLGVALDFLVSCQTETDGCWLGQHSQLFNCWALWDDLRPPKCPAWNSWMQQLRAAPYFEAWTAWFRHFDL